MLSAFDTQITLWLSSTLPHLPIFDSVFHTLSLTGATSVMWAMMVFAVFTWEFYVRQNKYVFLAQFSKLVVTLAISIAIAGVSANYLLKPVFQRARPYVAQNISAPYCPRDYSFPSGHATVAFAGAYILSKFDHDRRRRVLYLLLAVGVSYSRIYLLCHYLGDVVGGALYGVATAVVMYEIVHQLYHKYHKSPRI
ncbi:phosphatase PAP2 family protein [Candidatus Woesebacteria bacterium]|nr:phosphatase PAP2 family protein [Candidatus Woesebacteria bacterium]